MAARGVSGLIAVTALMGLATCGSVSVASAGQTASAAASSSRAPAAAVRTPAGGPLCAAGRGADRVMVSRTASPRQVTLSGVPERLAYLINTGLEPDTEQHAVVARHNEQRKRLPLGHPDDTRG